MGRLKTLPPSVPNLGPLVRHPPKIVESIYRTPEWRALVARIKRERGARCERCGSTHRVIADHVVELKDGGAPLDPRNVELLCQADHNQKTAASRAKRAVTPL